MPGHMDKKQKVRKMKGMTIDAKKMKKSEKEKAEKALKKIFEDNTSGRHSGAIDK